MDSILESIQAGYAGSPYLHAFKAATYRAFGQAQEAYAQECMTLADAGDWHGMTGDDVDRLTMPRRMYLAKRSGRRRGQN